MAILSPYEIVYDDISVIGLLTKGNYSEIYRVMKERMGLECLLKVNLPHEMISKDAPDPAYEFTKKKHRERTLDEAAILKEFVGAPNIVQMTDIIHFGDYSGILFAPNQPISSDIIGKISGTLTLRELMDTQNDALSKNMKSFVKLFEIEISPELRKLIGFEKQKDDLRKMKSFVKLSKGLFSGLQELIYGPDIIHRDIRPENIIISNRYVPVLIDFGLAVKADKIEKGIWGSRTYAPPEIYYRAGDHDSDCWHVGLILYEFLTGEHLIDNSPDVNERRKNIIYKVKSLDNKIAIVAFYEELIEKFSKLEKQYSDFIKNAKNSRMRSHLERKPDIYQEFRKYLTICACFCEPIDSVLESELYLANKTMMVADLDGIKNEDWDVVKTLEEHLKLVKEL